MQNYKQSPTVLFMGLVGLVCCQLVAGEISLTTVLSDKTAEVSSLSHMNQLVQQAAQDEAAAGKFAAAFADLKPLLELVAAGNVCDVKSAQAFRKWNFAYMRQKKPCPTPLRRFFIALMFQVSAKCQELLVDQLKSATAGKLTDSDYEVSTKLDSFDGAKFAQVKHYSNILFSFEQAILFPPAEKKQRKASIVVRKEEDASRIARLCVSKFEAFYKPLIAPLSYYAYLGYDYRAHQGPLLDKLAPLRTDEFFHRWYSIAYKCNFLKSATVFLHEPLIQASFIGRFVDDVEMGRLQARYKTIKMPTDTKPSLSYKAPATPFEDELMFKGQQLDQIITEHSHDLDKSERTRLLSLIDVKAMKTADYRYSMPVNDLKNDLFMNP